MRPKVILKKNYKKIGWILSTRYLIFNQQLGKKTLKKIKALKKERLLVCKELLIPMMTYEDKFNSIVTKESIKVPKEWLKRWKMQ